MSTAKPALIKQEKSKQSSTSYQNERLQRNGEKKIPRKTWLRVRIGIMNVRAFELKYDQL